MAFCEGIFCINKKLKSKYAFKGSLDNAAITQLVECLAVNQDVTGSSPVGGALVFELFN